MDPEQARMLVPLHQIGGADVSRQHALFNHLVRIVAGAWQDFFDLAGCIADDVGFGGFKIDRAACLARLQQGVKDFIQMQQVRHQAGTLGCFRAFGVTQDGRHFCVRQACRGMNHRGIELVSLDLTLGADHGIAHQRQAVDVGIERTQAIG